MNLRDSTSALGLYDCDVASVEQGWFRRFYMLIVDQMEAWGGAPTYIAVDGPGYSGKFVAFQGRTLRKLTGSNFDGVHGLSIVANPPGSGSPAHDSFVHAALMYVSSRRALNAFVVANEAYAEIGSTRYQSLIRSMADVWRWSFGYGFSSRVEERPELHLLGLDNGRLSPDEYASLCRWYAAPGALRMTSLRDVYPYNILNESQLDAQARDGLTLRAFAQRQPGCSLERLTGYGLHLWHVPAEALARCKAALAGSPVLLG